MRSTAKGKDILKEKVKCTTIEFLKLKFSASIFSIKIN